MGPDSRLLQPHPAGVELLLQRCHLLLAELQVSRGRRQTLQRAGRQSLKVFPTFLQPPAESRQRDNSGQTVLDSPYLDDFQRRE